MWPIIIYIIVQTNVSIYIITGKGDTKEVMIKEHPIMKTFGKLRIEEQRVMDLNSLYLTFVINTPQIPKKKTDVNSSTTSRFQILKDYPTHIRLEAFKMPSRDVIRDNLL